MHKSVIGAGDPYLLRVLWVKYQLIFLIPGERKWWGNLCRTTGITGELYALALWFYVRYYGCMDPGNRKLWGRETLLCLDSFGQHEPLVKALMHITLRLEKQSERRMEMQKDFRAEYAEYAERIKAAVPIREFLEMNGIQVNRRGFAVCPLHGDKNPSLKVYGGDRGWACFGCHKGGNVINLAMELYGIGFRDAVRRLNDEFHVGIDFDRKQTPRETFLAAANMAKRRARRAREEEEKEALEERYRQVFDQWLGLDRLIQDMAEEMDRDGNFPDAFCEALQKRSEVYGVLERLEAERIETK